MDKKRVENNILDRIAIACFGTCWLSVLALLIFYNLEKLSHLFVAVIMWILITGFAAAAISVHKS